MKTGYFSSACPTLLFPSTRPPLGTSAVTATAVSTHNMIIVCVSYLMLVYFSPYEDEYLDKDHSRRKMKKYLPEGSFSIMQHVRATYVCAPEGPSTVALWNDY